VVLPMAAFAAAVYVTNRLSSDSELVVVQTTGYSSFRLVRPVLVFGALVAVLMALLTHLLVPASTSRLAVRSAEIAQNITARILTEGTFVHPSNGVTFYLREITPEGELKDIFLSDARDPERRTTYTADTALLIREDAGPKLVMFNGVAQIMQHDGNRLFTTSFQDFAFDLGALIEAVVPQTTNIRALSTAALVDGSALDRFSAIDLRNEFHRRFVQPLMPLTAALVGFAALLVGGFSRFGVWRQIVGAMVLLVILQFVESAAVDITRDNGALWLLTYSPAVLGIVMAVILLWVSERPGLLKRRRAVPA